MEDHALFQMTDFSFDVGQRVVWIGTGAHDHGTVHGNEWSQTGVEKAIIWFDEEDFLSVVAVNDKLMLEEEYYSPEFQRELEADRKAEALMNAEHFGVFCD